ncbi:hypothetical protein PPL_07410 [Heterostelium album PN500]|uniref:Uncharacterized protein n=1 Tax=Heterostelium pallidum (strain ATCC 26659 / Pp 5 / PN500) TaxID=670386 RepID=D3BFV9_HETP5|nr:hypothetical protein PPL_07410 [Heterostelium album PN500]EFA79719.1 hypothetical protein PPL_07410 [Heterostelium album PN500]|eukprot:XP_020431840.1 hypothetical protein PPL_07410 [Heterostelium album PN500]
MDDLFKSIIKNQYIRSIIYSQIKLIHRRMFGLQCRTFVWKELITDEYQLAYHGYFDILRQLKEENKKNSSNSSAISNYLNVLTKAVVIRGNLEFLQYLVERGEFLDGNELSFAVEHGHFHIVEYLLQLDPSVCKHKWLRSLWMCSQFGYSKLFIRILKLQGLSAPSNFISICQVALENGHKELGMWIFQNLRPPIRAEMVEAAIKLNDFQLLEKISIRNTHIPASFARIAARLGNIEILEHLYKRNKRCLNSSVVDAALEANQKETFYYLIREKRIRYGKHTFQLIAANGDLEMLKELGGAKQQFCGKLAFSSAAENNHMHILEYINGKDSRIHCLPSSLLKVIERGHTDVYRFLLERQPSIFNRKLLDRLAAIGDRFMDELSHLVLTLKVVPSPLAFENAVVNNQFETILFLYDHTVIRPEIVCMRTAVKLHHTHIARWLNDNCFGMEFPSIIEPNPYNPEPYFNLLMIYMEVGMTIYSMDLAIAFVYCLVFFRFELIEQILAYGDNASLLDDVPFVKELTKYVFNHYFERFQWKSFEYFIRKFKMARENLAILEHHLTRNTFMKSIANNQLEICHLLFTLAERPKTLLTHIMAERSLPFLKYIHEHLRLRDLEELSNKLKIKDHEMQAFIEYIKKNKYFNTNDN